MGGGRHTGDEGPALWELKTHLKSLVETSGSPPEGVWPEHLEGWSI